MEKNGRRNISLDLLRILAMLGIVCLHLIENGGVLNIINMHSIRSYIILFIFVICFLSVNIFAILSGYLSWNKEKVKYKRIIELIFICLFFFIVITAIFYFFNLYNIQHLGKRIIINSLFPALIGRNWYITSYIFLFFLMPYLNFFINNISKDKFKKMLIVLFILISIIPNIFYLTDFFKVSNGYSPFWLIYCYFLGAYIGKYLNNNKISKKMIITLIGCVLGAFILNSIVRIVTPMIYGKLKYNLWFMNYISPFTVIASIIIVMIFTKINITLKNTFLKKFIYYLSISSFSVYAIHSHYLIYDFVLKDILLRYTYSNIFILVGYIILGVIIIYLVCFLIDQVRKLLFKLLRIDILIDLIGNKLNKVLD